MDVTQEEVMRNLSSAKMYVFALLLDGEKTPKTDAEEKRVEQLQMEHLKYLFQLKKLGKLPLFGPLTDGGKIHGILIFATENLDEAKKLLEQDPFVQSGYLSFELHPYYAFLLWNSWR